MGYFFESCALGFHISTSCSEILGKYQIVILNENLCKILLNSTTTFDVMLRAKVIMAMAC